MRTREQDVEPFVNLSELTEIELLILRRMREYTIGEHRSVFHGTGFDYVGLRDWQAGDRMSQIDWPQSTLKNFSPMVVRDFEQRSTATVIAVADGSLSTRCGIDGIPIAAAIARSIGTIGMSAVFFQDMFGLITFGANFEELHADRQEPGHPLPRGVSVPDRDAAAPARRHAQHDALGLHAEDVDGPGDLRLP